MANVKISQFQRTDIVKDNDDLTILQDGVNKIVKSPILESKILEKAKEYIVNSGVGFGGFVDLETPHSELNNAYFFPTESGVYENFGGVEVDLSNGFYIIEKKDENYDSFFIPVQLGTEVNTIDDLRLKIGAEGDIITLLGYYEKGDKEPLNYKYTTDQGVDDGGAVINTSNGSWIAVFGDKINILDFGAKANEQSFDNTASIQKSLDTASFLRKSIFIDNTYYVTTQLSGRNIFLPEYSSITGGGKLMLSDNSINSTSKSFNFFNSLTNNNTIVNIDSITFDFNGDNNYIPGEKLMFCTFCYIIRAKSVIINNVNVSNNGGQQTIVIGDNLEEKHINKAIVKNSYFESFGNDVLNHSLQTDHSVIYAKTKNTIIYNNTFLNKRQDYNQTTIINWCTAMEIHSDNSRCYNNYIYNYRNVFNIVSAISSNINSSFYKNSCYKVGRLAELWAFSNNEMSNLKIHNNYVEQFFPYPLIDAKDQLYTNVKDVSIYNNMFLNKTTLTDLITFGMFYISNIENIIITKNTFKDFKNGILIQPSDNDNKNNIKINNNTFINIGDSASTGYTDKFVILFIASNSVFNNIYVKDNNTERGLNTANIFFKTEGKAKYFEFSNNNVSFNLDFLLLNDVTHDYFLLVNNVRTDVNNYNCSLGSEVVNILNGKRFIKTSNNLDVGNLEHIEWGSSTTTNLGNVKKGTSVPNGSSIDTLLISLRNAGIIEP